MPKKELFVTGEVPICATAPDTTASIFELPGHFVWNTNFFMIIIIIFFFFYIRLNKKDQP